MATCFVYTAIVLGHPTDLSKEVVYVRCHGDQLPSTARHISRGSATSHVRHVTLGLQIVFISTAGYKQRRGCQHLLDRFPEVALRVEETSDL